MRYIIAVGLVLATASCATRGQPDTAAASAVSAQTPAERNVYCFVDGRTVSCEEWQRYSRDTIDRILILRGFAAADRFGPDADGAILVTMRSTGAAMPSATRSDLIFYFIDGRTASRADFERLPRDNIHSIEILQSWAAVDRYGPDADAGVFRVTTKRAR
jgi:hypothetical protein